MIKNKINFVPAKYALQPKFYIERFNRVVAVFEHPINGRNIFLQVEAEFHFGQNPKDASGPLLICCQTEQFVKTLSQFYNTLSEAMIQIEKLMTNPNYGDKFDPMPILVEDLRDGRYANKVLVDRMIKAHKQYRKAHPYRKPAIPFTLTKDDKKTLLNWGHLVKDFPQIENAANLSIFDLDEKESVSWEGAVDAIGREAFLSGISRSAFHWSSAREGIGKDGNKHEIYFESGTESPFRKNF